MNHPDFPLIDIPAPLLSSGWSTRDVWHNDACVRLTRPGWSLWVDHADPAQREIPGARFALVPTDDELEPLAPESFAETLDELEALTARFGI